MEKNEWENTSGTKATKKVGGTNTLYQEISDRCMVQLPNQTHIFQRDM